MRILLDPSGYAFRNLGDAAMLEVALRRIRAHWPHATVTVLGFDADALAGLDAEARVLDPYGAIAWSATHSAALGAIALLAKRRSPRAIRDHLAAVRTADLVLVSGGGHLNDAFRAHAVVVLDTLTFAMKSGAVTALVGQGIGPIDERRLRARATAVLPRIDRIALREGVAGVPLLASMGVASERVRVTGDDAIPLAYAARSETPGDALGVNVRVASYAQVSEEMSAIVGRVVRDLGVPLLPVPIAVEDDLAVAEQLLQRYFDGPRTLDELLQTLRRCRVVVTGSYHAAVFALSMGIPAVTLASSAYYLDKFRGLAAQFGSACRCVSMSEPGFERRLRFAIDDAWTAAGDEREELLERARQQIALAEAAFAELAAFVDQRKPRRNE